MSLATLYIFFRSVYYCSMTIKTRNRLLKALFFFSIICCILLAASLTVALLTDAIVPPSDSAVQTSLQRALRGLPFMRCQFAATMTAIGIMALYVPVTLFLIIAFFENTQSSEIIFFAGVLLGILCEGIRMLIPLFGLGLSFSHFLIFIGRVLAAGRFTVPLCFFCMATFSETHQRQDVERNLTVVLALSVVLAAEIPLNTALLTTTCAIPTGFATVSVIVRFLIFALALLSFLLNARKHGILEMKKMALYYVVLVVGYVLLLLADSFVLLGLGTAALALGTVQFLRNLHRLYKWK